MKRALTMLALASFMVSASAADAAKAPSEWDGLVQVKSKRLEHVFLQPGADFRGYTKILMEPPEVAFYKNWKRDYNYSHKSLSSRVSDEDVQEAVRKGVTAASDIFNDAWTKGGYTIVDAPGPDVLRIRTGIVNIRVNAPDQQSAGRSYNFAPEAGSATLFVEARDSTTGALLGRAVDSRLAGDQPTGWRSAVTNRADFRDLVATWASASVRGITELKSRSPIAP